MLLDFDKLHKKYNLKTKGVLHLGASEGQEASTYHKYGMKMAFVEALPHIYKRLVNKVKQYQAKTYHACVSDITGQKVSFNVANNAGQSSSLLEFGTHKEQHPSVKFVGKINLTTIRAEELIDDMSNYNLLVMDLQGAELMAVKGLGEKIKGFDYVYTEVNWDHVYQGCALIGEIDDYLGSFGFTRVETFKMNGCTWGDAFYIKGYNRPMNKAINDAFQPKQNPPYPIDNENEFEWWFKENYHQGKNERIYIPVMWTSFQLRNDKNQSAKRLLQQYLNGLDKTKKYFTVVQHDDGIKFQLPPDTKVFSMGKPGNYNLPLVCEPHKYKFDLTRDITASFMGNVTHPVRNKLMRFKGIKQYYISTSIQSTEEFCKIMARSIFALCPRGYGVTSFRIMEALQYGAIPVYISDEFMFPHGVDFNEYGVVVRINEINNIPHILTRMNFDEIAKKQEAGSRVFKEYFTYESNLHLIRQNI